jgi:hypothetical protein
MKNAEWGIIFLTGLSFPGRACAKASLLLYIISLFCILHSTFLMARGGFEINRE